MATKETKKSVNEVGIIGQMYEERKSKKLGVLESRNEKFKTLMMRDNNGTSFTVQYSTFRSNWRKYQGEEVIQTSEQKEEVKQAAKEELKEAKKEMAKSTETTIKFSRQERIDAIKALRTVLKDAIKDAKYPLELVNLAKGGTVVKLKGKRRTMFEIWLPLRYPDVYSFRMREDIAKYVDIPEEKEYLEKDVNCIRFRPKRERFDDVLKVVLTAVEKFVEDTDFLHKDEENEKTKEKEKN
jgi:hypothetical protein